jgi:hypothetical protein
MGDGVTVPDVGVKIVLRRGVVRGVIWKFRWIGTERTRLWGRGGGDVVILWVGDEWETVGEESGEVLSVEKIRWGKWRSVGRESRIDPNSGICRDSRCNESENQRNNIPYKDPATPEG